MKAMCFLGGFLQRSQQDMIMFWMCLVVVVVLDEQVQRMGDIVSVWRMMSFSIENAYVHLHVAHLLAID